MRKRILSTVMTIIMVLSLCIGSVTPIVAAPAVAKTITVTFDITNKMSKDIFSMKMSAPWEEAWGKELIKTPIKSGTTAKIPLTISSSKPVYDFSLQTEAGENDPIWGMTIRSLDFTGITAASGGLIILPEGSVFNKAGAVGAGVPAGKDTITANFTVKNDTHVEMRCLQLNPPGQEAATPNLLKAPLAKGASVTFPFTFSPKASKWDLYATSTDGTNNLSAEEVDFTGITAAKGCTIVIKLNPVGTAEVFSNGGADAGLTVAANTKTIPFNVKNETGAKFVSFKISPAGKDAWSANLLTVPLSKGATVVIPITFSDAVSLWDISADSDNRMADLDVENVDLSALTPESGGNLALRYTMEFGMNVVVSNNRPKTAHPKQSGNTLMFFDTDSDGVLTADEVKEQMREAGTNMDSGIYVSLSDNINTIGKNAFSTIGKNAFTNIPITKLTLPSSVKTIQDEAFANNNRLGSVIFAEGLVSTGYGVFSKTGLRSVSLPKSLKIIGDNCFSNCEQLTDITIQEGTTTIVSGAFSATPITGIKLPESLTTLGASAFKTCTKLKSITIPAGMKKIEEGTFAKCTALTEINLLGVTSIGDQVFLGCTALKKLQLPATLASVGFSIVDFCTKLVAISVDPANPNFTTQDGILYSKDMTAIYDYPNGRADKTLVLPATVTVIKAGAFGNTFIENVILPAGLKTIEGFAFNHCAALKGIAIPEGLEKIGEQAFFACTSLSGNVVLPKSMKEYGPDIFRMTGLNNVTINSNIDLSNGMFLASQKIETVKINGEFSKIGQKTFMSCIKLNSINLPKTLKTIDSGAFDSCTSLPSITLPEGLVNLGKIMIESSSDTENNGGIFYNCTSLKSITIPNSVIFIESGSFSKCKSMKSAKLPVNVKYNKIESQTFLASGLEDIFIPKNVITIGEEAFSWAALKKMTIEPNGVKYIEGSAFRHSKLESVVLPVGVLTMDFCSFADMNQLKEVTLSSTIENVPTFAFSAIPNCTRVNIISLKDLEIAPFNFEEEVMLAKGAFHVPKNFYGDSKVHKSQIRGGVWIYNDLPVLPKGKAGY